MLGVLLTIVWSALAALAGRTFFNKWLTGLDPAEKWGASGLLGLGTFGLTTFLIGLLPHGVNAVVLVLPLLGLVVAVIGLRSVGFKDLQFVFPRSYQLLALTAVVVIGLLALVGVLAPSIASDWDTIAYHLAVPKLWLKL